VATKNSCNNLVTTENFRSLQCERTTFDDQKISFAPYHGDTNFSITIEGGACCMFLKKTLDEGFPKTYDMPPFLVTIGQWGCVGW